MSSVERVQVVDQFDVAHHLVVGVVTLGLCVLKTSSVARSLKLGRH